MQRRLTLSAAARDKRSASKTPRRRACPSTRTTFWDYPGPISSALEFLQRQRLRVVARNVLCRGGEIDLVMRERDGTLVFVEIRAHARRHCGGAAASIGWHEKRRIVRATRHYPAIGSQRSRTEPVCRFDVIAFEGGRLVWLCDAFRADEV